MKLKIVNLSKFIRSIFVVLAILIGITLFISNTSFSHGESSYKTIYVANGDTLWSIAKQEKETNIYYENKDIRDVMNHIKQVNKLSSSDLFVNQELTVPKI